MLVLPWDNSLEFCRQSSHSRHNIRLDHFGRLRFYCFARIARNVFKEENFLRLTLHSKIVIITSGFLIFAGMLFIFFGEFLNALDSYTLFEKIQIAFSISHLANGWL